MKIELLPHEEKLFRDCIVIYGPDKQLEQYAEECLEAALAVRRFLRAKQSNDITEIKEKLKELYGEIIDTTVMSIQMKNVLLNEDQFDEIWNYKVNRQIKRVEKKLNPEL